MIVTRNRGRCLVAAVLLCLGATVAGAADKPNILVVWGDDVGRSNISAYTHGLVGYKTPNIDRIANEGLTFTDYYGEQSCTAGRSSFITGQSVFRTGLSKVGLPGADLGLREEDPTIAALLKAQGYATGQFGKNHLGDKDEFLPTNHGFDEFFGNLYHLNAEDEPEHPDYPRDPEFKKRFGPRGVIHSYADGRIEDTGPLTKQRMEHVDEEFTAAAIKFMERAHQSGKPFFIWWNATRMHIWTRLGKEAEGRTGLGIYPDGMVEHDGHVGRLLDKLDELGIADNTIVMYSTDNGAETFSWPDGGTTVFRGEKNTTWEGGFRAPAMIRWPGTVAPGTVNNQIGAHEDMLPTLLAAAGAPDIKEKLLKGYGAGDRSYKVHLDGYNLMPALQGKAPWPRHDFIYWTDDGDLSAVRRDDWKIMFMVQEAHGLAVWQEPFKTLRIPKIFNLRTDPFERADYEAMGYPQWWVEHAFLFIPTQAYIQQWLQSFKEFPPRQKPSTFGVEELSNAIYRMMPDK